MKVYEKPKLYFESFELTVGIALECAVPQHSMNSCTSADGTFAESVCEDWLDESYCEEVAAGEGSFYS